MYLLDVDGVICDFFGGVEDFFGLPLDPHSYNLAGQLGLTQTEFIEVLDEHFWANLKPMNDWLVPVLGKVILCSAAGCESPAAAAGRHKWVKKHYPELELISIRNKSLIKGTLIDDLVSNNPAILFPAPHNSLRNIKHVKEYICTKL